MTRKFALVFVTGEAADLNAKFVRPYGAEAIVEISEDTYQFLYNTVLERAVEEQRGDA